MMDYISQEKLARVISDGTHVLKQMVEEIVAASAPYKTEVELVRGYLDGVKIKHEGQEYYINQRYCYFSLGLVQPGDKVIIDIRYISNL